MRSFHTYKQLQDNLTVKIEKTDSIELDVEDVASYATVIAEFASSVKNTESLNQLLQETKNHTGKAIEMRDRLSLHGLYKMAGILAGVMNPKSVSQDEFHEFAYQGDSGYANLRVNMVKHVAEREGLTTSDFVK